MVSIGIFLFFIVFRLRHDFVLGYVYSSSLFFPNSTSFLNLRFVFALIFLLWRFKIRVLLFLSSRVLLKLIFTSDIFYCN